MRLLLNCMNKTISFAYDAFTTVGETARLDTCFFTSYALAWSTMSSRPVSMLCLIVRIGFVLGYRINVTRSAGACHAREFGYGSSPLPSALSPSYPTLFFYRADDEWKGHRACTHTVEKSISNFVNGISAPVESSAFIITHFVNKTTKYTPLYAPVTFSIGTRQ